MRTVPGTMGTKSSFLRDSVLYNLSMNFGYSNGSLFYELRQVDRQYYRLSGKIRRENPLAAADQRDADHDCAYADPLLAKHRLAQHPARGDGHQRKLQT